MTFYRIGTYNFIVVLAIFCVFGVSAGSATSQIDVTAPDGISSLGRTVTALPNGNIVVTASLDDKSQETNRAVLLYNGKTGALISVLTGRYAGGNILILPSGNFLVQSYYPNEGGDAEIGAVTWCSQTSGCSGPISAANSLVGSTPGDQIGRFEITVLPNGNYIVASPYWDNGAAANAGAVTWCSGTQGCAGAISAENSLVGTQSGDHVGWIVRVLASGHYAVASSSWTNGTAAGAGAVTWGNGWEGIRGEISAANSLVGTQTNDHVGYPNVVALSNGHYVISSRPWNNGTGAVTWCNGFSGSTGTISAANSLVGNRAGDYVGTVTALTNGNYVVSSEEWYNGAAQWAGAVTWGNGQGGTIGPVTAANSLVGTHSFDHVGKIYPLPNGNYVVASPGWDDGTTANVGAITWGNGAGGTVGEVSPANSLIGTKTGDLTNVQVITLANSNYVITSKVWNFGAMSEAVTWGSGQGGTVGRFTSRNSLLGRADADKIGHITPLPNGNYVVKSYYWNNATNSYAGKVTLVNGFTNTEGFISDAGSLLVNDIIDSYVAPLADSSYVVISPRWDNKGVDHAGAVTWCSASGTTVGQVSAANSLVGTQDHDLVGNRGIYLLSNGNYVVVSGY